MLLRNLINIFLLRFIIIATIFFLMRLKYIYSLFKCFILQLSLTSKRNVLDNKIFHSEVQWWLWWRCCPFTFCNTHSTVSAGGIFMPLMWSLSITFTFSSFIIFPFTSNIVFSLSFPNFLFVWCYILCDLWKPLLLVVIFYLQFLLELFSFTFYVHLGHWIFSCLRRALNIAMVI